MAMAEAMMPKTLPGGGLASFLTSNLDEIDDSVLAFGRPSGINSMRDVAERMAQMGRGGDNFVVHASEREMMVPREVVENNPQLRRQIMKSIAAEGADPNAYIVGNEANSINPMTGQPEFLLKGLKKIVKGVKNVVKKIAPIVLPVALNFLFPGMGTIAAGALGSGIGTLIQGGNIKDAFKSALIGGAMGGLYSGVSGAMSGQGFMSGVRQGFTGTPGMGFFELNPQVRNFFGGGARTGQFDVTASSRGEPATAQGQGTGTQLPSGAEETVSRIPANRLGADGTERSLFDRLLGTNRPTADQLVGTERARLASLFPNLTPEQIDLRILEAGGATMGQPTMLQRFGPTLAGGLALGAVTGAFNPVPAAAPVTPGYEKTTEELIAENPEAYYVERPGPTQFAQFQDIAINPYNQTVPMLPPIYTPPITVQPINLPQMQPVQFAAMGGEMESFPRRLGAISGPGTETSDAVPAMLSDGEFVMTARAVRGAGNGDRERGVRRMYDMMRMFEGGVAR